MDKNVLAIGAVAVVVLIGGAFYVGQQSTIPAPIAQNTAQENNIATQPAQPSVANTAPTTKTQNDNLDKKIQCANQRQSVQDDLNSRTTGYYLNALYQVFYSPSLDSCLSAEYVLSTDQGAGGELLQIRDILTGRIIWNQYYETSMKYWEAYAILDAQIAIIQ